MNYIVAETEQDVRRTLPPVECTSWCTHGDGHTEQMFPEDQYCVSASISVDLLRERPVEGQLDNLSAQLYRERFEAEPHVEVHQGDGKVASMTLDEAESFSRQLLVMVGRARGAMRN